ncbi:MAG: peroxiredoxin [Polyangiaceae bacterium]|nr:peroxiredoxin [Polyangiaceae bacterium]
MMPALRNVFFAAVVASSVACGATSRPDGGEGLLAVGASAPDVSAPDQTGTVKSLSAERGHPVVVFFYPKDGTPGCTKEACAFRDAWDKYQAAGVQVLGVSADDVKSKEQFAKEQSLPFPILADPEHKWSTAFGVSTKLGMMERVSFLIAPDGKIAKVYPDVDPAIHATTVLADVGAQGWSGAGATPASSSAP